MIDIIIKEWVVFVVIGIMFAGIVLCVYINHTQRKRWTIEKQTTCVICGVRSKNRNWQIAGITFNWLESTPTICEKCIYEKITETSAKWNDAVKRIL